MTRTRLDYQRRFCGAVLAAVLAITLTSAALAQNPPKPDKPASVEKKAEKGIYDTKADANELISQAVRKAAGDNQRVLVMFGGNWCGWCHKLHDVFTNNRDIAKLVKSEYQLVLVDIGNFDKHMDLVSKYGVDLKKVGVPYLVVLDAEGKALTRQETGSLEVGAKHDPAKVTAFLDKWKAPAADAEKVMAKALLQATAENKRIFLRLSAPWCTWCHRLGDFLADEEVAKLIGQDYIDVKIDLERMKNGPAVAAEYRKTTQGGIPWFAVIDTRGNVLATADGPKGNVGFPVSDEEVAHFMKVLTQTRRTLSQEQIATIETKLKAAGKQYKNH
ncbi:thioredoxin family protein [uncultured Ilyobacter sp.]|uniref:thioredoxin family protein n=1 Tax=uncultured Ilyobacter sp. TaxID=544433 RepID=UPI0029F56874|nr:thioredoxin family protein [uncultured Ilyobacter sp.]